MKIRRGLQGESGRADEFFPLAAKVNLPQCNLAGDPYVKGRNSLSDIAGRFA
jgi:hypothetical protein